MCTRRLQYFGSMDKQCIVVYYSTTLNGDTITYLYRICEIVLYGKF